MKLKNNTNTTSGFKKIQNR